MLVGNRQAQRDARTYVAPWWQAIREWDKHSDGGDLVIGSGKRRPSAGRMQVVGVGDWSGAPTGAVWHTKLHTPLSWVSESTVAQAISGPLECLWGRGGLATLIHASGRGWASDAARTAGAATLALSQEDQKALGHLSHLPSVEDRPTLFVNSQTQPKLTPPGAFLLPRRPPEKPFMCGTNVMPLWQGSG